MALLVSLYRFPTGSHVWLTTPALTAAAKAGAVLPVYILDDGTLATIKWVELVDGVAAHSLQALNDKLDGKLLVLKGDPVRLLPALAVASWCKKIVWNRCYEPWRLPRYGDKNGAR